MITKLCYSSKDFQLSKLVGWISHDQVIGFHIRLDLYGFQETQAIHKITEFMNRPKCVTRGSKKIGGVRVPRTTRIVSCMDETILSSSIIPITFNNMGDELITSLYEEQMKEKKSRVPVFPTLQNSPGDLMIGQTSNMAKSLFHDFEINPQIREDSFYQTVKKGNMVLFQNVFNGTLSTTLPSGFKGGVLNVLGKIENKFYVFIGLIGISQPLEKNVTVIITDKSYVDLWSSKFDDFLKDNDHVPRITVTDSGITRASIQCLLNNMTAQCIVIIVSFDMVNILPDIDYHRIILDNVKQVWNSIEYDGTIKDAILEEILKLKSDIKYAIVEENIYYPKQIFMLCYWMNVIPVGNGMFFEKHVQKLFDDYILQGVANLRFIAKKIMFCLSDGK